MGNENQRQAQRYDVRVDVEYTIGDKAKTGPTKNMSLGGLYVESTDKLALGSRMKVKFRVPTQKDPIEVGAVVRWTDGAGFGVQFDGLRARDVWALGKFFEQPR